MEALTSRQAEMVALARAAGLLNVEDLAGHFALSPQTIRKDLAELCERGVLRRFHGGAVLAPGSATFDYEARRTLAIEEKRRIGLKAAALIPDGASLLVHIGTTVEQLAIALRAKRGLTVITNNVNMVTLLTGYQQIEIILAGGVVRHADGGVVGDATVDFVRQFRADYAVIGAPAIDVDGTLLGFDYREVEVARSILECARRSILVADTTKLGRAAPVRIGHISELDHFVTDAPLPPRLAEICREGNVRVEIADAP